MTSPARFQSPAAQRRAVTVVMAAVFAGTLALAMVTAATREPPQPVSVSHAGLTFDAPGDWARDERQARALGMDRGLVLSDPEREGRWLLVTRTDLAEPADQGEMLSRYLSALLDPVQERTLEPLAAQGSHALGELRAAQYIGRSRPPAGTAGMQLHMAMGLTLDGRQHWLIYLTDRVTPGEATGAVLRQNLALLRSVEQSLRLEEPR